MFSIFSTAQKLPKIFTEFFEKCKIYHKKKEKISNSYMKYKEANKQKQIMLNCWKDPIIQEAILGEYLYSVCFIFSNLLPLNLRFAQMSRPFLVKPNNNTISFQDLFWRYVEGTFTRRKGWC